MSIDDQVSRIRQPQPIITEPLLEARVDSASRPGLGSLPVEDLLERISELEATYHLTMKLWAYPQLRKSRYWDRRKICECRRLDVRLYVRADINKGSSSIRWAKLRRPSRCTCGKRSLRSELYPRDHLPHLDRYSMRRRFNFLEPIPRTQRLHQKPQVRRRPRQTLQFSHEPPRPSSSLVTTSR